MQRLIPNVLMVLLVGCADSHGPTPGMPCELTGDGRAACPEGTYCALASHSTVARTCRTICDPGGAGAPYHFRCDSGEVCSIAYEPPPAEDPPTCWTGGELEEGQDCLSVYECARGLWCAEDLSIESERGARCEPVCNDQEDCRPGEVCVLGIYCAPPCDRTNPATCPDGPVCVANYCVWAPRAADCDRDGTPDCPVGQICTDAVGPGSCFEPADYPFDN